MKKPDDFTNRSGTAPAIGKKGEYSQSYQAQYVRSRVTNDPAYADRMASNVRKWRAKQKHVAILARGTNDSHRRRALKSRVAHHMARGRSLADIVVRESMPASVVSKMIEELNNEKA